MDTPSKIVIDNMFSLCYRDNREGGMARVVIDGFPDDLHHELKIKAVQEKTTVKALLIAAAEKLLGKKAEGLSKSSQELLNKYTPGKAGKP